MRPLEARWFYAVCALSIVLGALVVAAWPDLVSLNVAVQVMNAFMLGFLIALAVKALPRPHRLSGSYLWIVVIVATVTCALGVLGGLSGAGPGVTRLRLRP